MAEEGSLKCEYISECNIVYPWIFIICTSCGLNHLPGLLHLEENYDVKKGIYPILEYCSVVGFNKSPVCLKMR